MKTVPRIALSGISKRFGDALANRDVSVEVSAGEIHALLGENGAGKSTLMKIAYGAVQPDAGQIRWNGQRVELPSPEAARALGIAMVFQHLSLFETLTVEENLWLAHPQLKRSALRERAVASGLASAAELARPVYALSVGERQRVELLRALLGDPKLLILDEPTSLLAPDAIAELFALLRKLAADGCAILYVSHKLDEIRSLCDSCSVLRKGSVTGRVVPSRESHASLSRLMLGADPPLLTRQPAQPGKRVLEVRGLSLPARDHFDKALHEIELTVHAREIVGIAGLSGHGQSQLVAALSGEDTRAPAGTIKLRDKDLSRHDSAARRALGLRFVPEERLGRGAVPSMSLACNTLLTRDVGVGRFGFVHWSAVARLTSELIERLGVVATGPSARADSLSGGNLQKFILSRELSAQPELLIAMQPTWGVDVGAAVAIRAGLLALRDAGGAVLVVSEDLDELFEICDRVCVMADGRLSPSLAVEQTDMAQIGTYMSGLWATQSEVPNP